MIDLQQQLDLAEEHLERHDFAAASDLFTALLERRLHEVSVHREGETALDVALIDRAGDLAFLLGRALPAANLFAAARAKLNHAGNSFAADWMAAKESSSRLEVGDWAGAQKALVHLTSRLPESQLPPTDTLLGQVERYWTWPQTSEQERWALVARLLLELGKLHGSQGQYRAAVAYFEGGLACCRRTVQPDTPRARAALLLELAAACLERGDLSGCDSALDEGRSSDPQDLVVRIRHRELESRSALLQGELGRARDGLYEVRAECQRLALPMAAATASLNLAQLLVSLNQITVADQLAREVEAAASLAGDEATVARAQVVRRLSFDRGRSLADGVAIAPTVTEIWDAGTAPAFSDSTPPPTEDWPAGRSFLELFEMRCLPFHWMLSRHDWASARSYLDQLDAVFGTTDSMLIVGRRVALEGLLLYYEERWDEAARLLTEADSAFADLGIVLDRWQILRVRSWALGRLGDEAGAASDRLGSENLLEGMSESLSEVERAVFRLNKWTQEEESLAHDLVQLERVHRRSQAGSALGRLSARVDSLRQGIALLSRVDRHRRGVIENAVARASSLAAQPKWWKTALGYLSDSACVRFIVLPDRLAVIVLAGGRLWIGVTPITRIQLRELVAAIHQAIRTNDRSAFETEVRDLAEVLQWRKVLGALPKRCTRLKILPDDSLHGCPFSALASEDRTPKYSLTLGFELARRKQHSHASTALAVAIPHGARGFPPLTGASEEGDQFVDWCKSRGFPVHVVDPDRPTRNDVIQQLQIARFAHVVCHGFFQADRPDESGLLLIAQDGTVEKVSLRDLSQADLSSLEHLTLTSCWGADSFVLPGRFVISLPEICWRAGARQLLASLWEVHDAVAVDFVRRFYQYRTLETADRALARVQDDYRSGKAGEELAFDVSAPFFWAGFQLYGGN